MDILTKKERSKRMSLIKSKWTKQERKVHNAVNYTRAEARGVNGNN